MWEATPDPGALIVKTIVYKGKQITLANGFAANDPESTAQLWQKVTAKFSGIDTVVALVNCREDRADRSKQMAESIIDWEKNSHVLAIGSGIECFTKSLQKTYDVEVTKGEGWSVELVLDHLITLSKNDRILAIGVCNIAAIGFELLNYFCSQENVRHD